VTYLKKSHMLVNNLQCSLTPPLFIEVPVPSQKSEWSCTKCICVLQMCLSFYDFSIRFWNFYASVICIYTLTRRESGGYIGILMSIRHTFGFRIIIVPLNQIFSNLHTLLCTIKYRLSLITVYFTFTVHELWPFFS
jgi:hypothetical protein